MLVDEHDIPASAVGQAAIYDGGTLMSKRSVTILVVLAAVAFAFVFYAKERRSRLPVHVPLVARTAANTGRERKGANVAGAADVSPPSQKRFSQKEYDLLWQRYKPNSGLADGPLPADRRDNLGRITKNNTRDKKMWPVFRGCNLRKLYGA